MSRSSRLVCRIAVMAAALAIQGAAPAEIVGSGKAVGSGKTPAKTRPTEVESMARVTDNAPRSVLKCWQEGRLIFESNGVSLADAGSGTPPAMRGANGRTVQLLDMRHGLCILERSNG